MGNYVEIMCNEGFSLVNRVLCKEKGILEPNNGDYCGSIMGGQLQEIESQIKDGLENPQKISEHMLDVVKKNEFMFASEIDSSVKILRQITELSGSFSNNKVLANIFEATHTVSKKITARDKNVTQVQTCLDIVDLIGQNVRVEKSSAFKLAGEGLALTAVDVEQE